MPRGEAHQLTEEGARRHTAVQALQRQRQHEQYQTMSPREQKTAVRRSEPFLLESDSACSPLGVQVKKSSARRREQVRGAAFLRVPALTQAAGHPVPQGIDALTEAQEIIDSKEYQRRVLTFNVHRSLAHSRNAGRNAGDMSRKGMHRRWNSRVLGRRPEELSISDRSSVVGPRLSGSGSDGEPPRRRPGASSEPLLQEEGGSSHKRKQTVFHKNYQLTRSLSLCSQSSGRSSPDAWRANLRGEWTGRLITADLQRFKK